jgi:hypothetical protein
VDPGPPILDAPGTFSRVWIMAREIEGTKILRNNNDCQYFPKRLENTLSTAGREDQGTYQAVFPFGIHETGSVPLYDFLKRDLEYAVEG